MTVLKPKYSIRSSSECVKKRSQKLPSFNRKLERPLPYVGDGLKTDRSRFGRRSCGGWVTSIYYCERCERLSCEFNSAANRDHSLFCGVCFHLSATGERCCCYKLSRQLFLFFYFCRNSRSRRRFSINCDGTRQGGRHQNVT